MSRCTQFSYLGALTSPKPSPQSTPTLTPVAPPMLSPRLRAVHAVARPAYLRPFLALRTLPASFLSAFAPRSSAALGASSTSPVSAPTATAVYAAQQFRGRAARPHLVSRYALLININSANANMSSSSYTLAPRGETRYERLRVGTFGTYPRFMRYSGHFL